MSFFYVNAKNNNELKKKENRVSEIQKVYKNKNLSILN